MIRVITTVAPWVIVGAVLIPPAIKQLEPAENWFRVTSITIADSAPGKPIIMNVSRSISRPFVGDWVATVRHVGSDGVAVVCVANGTSAYRLDAVYPHPLTLDWWTYPIKCDLPVVRYRLDTVWRFEVASGVTKMVSAESNVFEIR